MLCKKCGRELPDDAVICTYCLTETAETGKSGEKKHNLFAVAGLICSLGSAIFIFVHAAPCFIFLAAGLAFCVTALIKAKKYKPYGKPFSIFGICACALSLILFFILN